MRAKETFISLTLQQKDWERYREHELAGVQPILKELGFILDSIQPQIGGERYLMSGYKLVLFGERIADKKRVVIKVSSYPQGAAEIEQERNAQTILSKIHFAHRTFFSPTEILFLKKGLYTIRITEFVHQDKPFLMRPLEEQFFLALKAFETQEGVHVTTHDHALTIKDVFGLIAAEDYLVTFEEFRTTVEERDTSNSELHALLKKASIFLRENRATIERYCGFLTHHDLSLHNFRVVGNNIYLLDHTSIYFGNKYEGWARFLNFMLQYNPALEKLLSKYVQENRGTEEYLDLRLMRIFKLGLLLSFYTSALKKTTGNLQAITRLRIDFWTHALAAILDDIPLEERVIEQFRNKQEELRTQDERERNKEALSALTRRE